MSLLLDPPRHLTRPAVFDCPNSRRKTEPPVAQRNDRLALNRGRHYSLTTSQYQVPTRGAGLPG
jgi:hypothetical protein